MRNYSFIKYFAFFFLITVGFSACEKDEAGDDFGDGSPKAENVVLRNGYAYEYNGQGLVTKMSKYETETDEVSEIEENINLENPEEKSENF